MGTLAARGRGLFHRMAAHPVGLLVEALAFVLLPAEQLDHLVRGDAFLDHLRDVAHRRCASRLLARSRLLMVLMMNAMTGAITSVSSVSFQFR